MGNLGYPFERETETALMGLRKQSRMEGSLGRRTHRVPASGALASMPGDVRTNLDFLEHFGQFLIECKDRKDGRGAGKSFRIDKAEWDKIRDEAIREGCIPAYAFKFKGDGCATTRRYQGDSLGNVTNNRGIAMPMSVFVDLLAYTRDLYDEVSALREGVADAAPGR